MSFIPTITCRRCGHQYSGLHSRCPKCGTRRVQQSGRTPAVTPAAVRGTAANARAAANARWQMIFGLILVVAIIIAVIVLVTTGIDSGRQQTASTPTPPPSEVTTPTPPPTPTPTPTPTVGSVTICYFNDERTEFAVRVGGSTPMNAVVYPLDITADVEWSVSNEEIISIAVTGDNNKQCTVTGVGVGTATLTATCGDKTANCTVYVNG